jgi:hypothetical protein
VGPRGNSDTRDAGRRIWSVARLKQHHGLEQSKSRGNAYPPAGCSQLPRLAASPRIVRTAILQPAHASLAGSSLPRQNSRAHLDIRPGLLGYAVLRKGAETLEGIPKTRHVANRSQEGNPGDQILYQEEVEHSWR